MIKIPKGQKGLTISAIDAQGKEMGFFILVSVNTPIHKIQNEFHKLHPRYKIRSCKEHTDLK